MSNFAMIGGSIPAQRFATLLALSLAGAAFVPAAHAADLAPADANPYYGPGSSAALYDWSGPYVGAHFGYGFGGANSTWLHGPEGGAQVGVNTQFGAVVLGTEGDIGVADIDHHSPGASKAIHTLGSLRLRAGFALDQMLIYGTGGFGFGEFRYASAGSEDSRWSLGWVVGVGAEAALSRNWTARVEAFRYDLGRSDYFVGGPHSVGVDATMVRVGLNYRF